MTTNESHGLFLYDGPKMSFCIVSLTSYRITRVINMEPVWLYRTVQVSLEHPDLSLHYYYTRASWILADILSPRLYAVSSILFKTRDRRPPAAIIAPFISLRVSEVFWCGDFTSLGVVWLTPPPWQPSLGNVWAAKCRMSVSARYLNGLPFWCTHGAVPWPSRACILAFERLEAEFTRGVI